MSPQRKVTYTVQLLLALWLAGIGAPATAQQLKLAAANTWPTAYEVDGKPAGILIDLVTEAYRRAGYTVVFKLMPWSRCLDEARSGTVDGVFSSFKLPERESFLYFSREVLMVQVISLFVRSNSPLHDGADLGALKDLKGGAISGTSYGKKFDDAVRSGVLVNVHSTNNIESNLKMLVAGRVDYVPSYRFVILGSAQDLQLLGKIKELAPPLESVPSYLAFTRVRDQHQAAKDFDAALAGMKRDGTYHRILEKYTGKN
jgi:polar amino acid transport system substrate-binding protein